MMSACASARLRKAVGGVRTPCPSRRSPGGALARVEYYRDDRLCVLTPYLADCHSPSDSTPRQRQAYPSAERDRNAEPACRAASRARGTSLRRPTSELRGAPEPCGRSGLLPVRLRRASRRSRAACRPERAGLRLWLLRDP